VLGVTIQLISEMESGLLVLLGIENEDFNEGYEWLIRKIINLRIFSMMLNGIMNNRYSKVEEILFSCHQFTLHASTKKGNRPSYIKAAKPEVATHRFTKLYLSK